MTCQQSDVASNSTDMNKNSSTSSFCSAVSDNVTCWPRTLAGSLAVAPCPTHFQDLLLFPGNVTRLCLENGTWQKPNYLPCLDPSVVISQTNSFHGHVRIMYYVGFSISVLALSVALFLFLFFRSLRCLRNIIHCHLIVTFILKYLLWLKMVPTLPILMLQDTSYVHQLVCKLIISLFNYLMVTSFFWMLIEGLYLHTVLVWSFSQDRLRFWHYAILGWGVPAIFIIAWALVKAKSNNTTCWLLGDANIDYIYVVPIFVALVINVVFLAIIVWILVTKLRASNSSQNSLYNYRKAAKATLILFPLLGSTYLLFFYLPEESNLGYLAYVNALLQSTQGFFVATFYCFLNVEVQSTVKKYLSRWQDGRRMSWRTQTSLVMQAEQVSLHAAGYRDDLMLKARAALRQMDDAKVVLGTEAFPLRATTTTAAAAAAAAASERGFANGVTEEEEAEKEADRLDRNYSAAPKTATMESLRQNGKSSRDGFDRSDDVEQDSDVDIIKEDLV